MLLAASSESGHNVSMSERDDYADNDLPPPRPWTETQIWIVVAIVLLLAPLVTAAIILASGGCRVRS
jgi:hypothetical protein